MMSEFQFKPAVFETQSKETSNKNNATIVNVFWSLVFPL